MADVLPNIHLTLPQVIALTEEIIAEKGSDYIYKKDERSNNMNPVTCAYVENGVPSCIVGHVLAATGLTDEQLLELEVSQYNDEMGVTLLDFLDCDDLTLSFLHSLQYAQDIGQEWGQAYLVALRHVGQVKAGTRPPARWLTHDAL